MTPEETKEFQAHLEAIAAILFKHTPREQLQDFESIERSVRNQLLEQVSPQIGNFFRQRHANQCGTKAPSPELFGSADSEPQASGQTGLKGKGAAESIA